MDRNNGIGGGRQNGGGPGASGGNISFRDILHLFCCPPFPSKIVSKLAFMPPQPSYKMLGENEDPSFELIERRAEWPHGLLDLRNVSMFYAEPADRKPKIACVYINATPESFFTILYSHGNAVDIGQMTSFYYGLAYRLNCNIFSYDYSGYGCSPGKASEKNLYNNITVALDELQKRFNIPPERVIVYGQSIGTVPSVDLASKNHRIAALILHSPLMSGLRVAFPGTQRSWMCDAFTSIDKIQNVQAPTLIIHGTEDEVIDFSHGLTLHERCPNAVDPLWVNGAGHNDIELHATYLERLRLFIETEALKTAKNESSRQT
uniref:Hydrolase_4 domain-containing protein n=1 Tax=Rhabditophanes sp. KR3021 TaxID=114890 RepID=A0AC35U050_9BILA